MKMAMSVCLTALLPSCVLLHSLEFPCLDRGQEGREMASTSSGARNFCHGENQILAPTEFLVGQLSFCGAISSPPFL